MNRALRFTILIIVLVPAVAIQAENSPLWREGISLIPYPRQAALGGDEFVFGARVSLVLDEGATGADRFAARDLASRLRADWDIDTALASGGSAGSTIVLTRSGAEKDLGDQGYSLSTEKDRITIRANGEAGLFYGTRTLLQIIRRGRSGPFVSGMKIVDRPDILLRAVHYDTKHFQEKREYVENFIRTLADYKINMLIWEWEDKFAYRSHPEIGAPGAFTLEEMQELTRHARKYHVQLVPLVQGLGHVSFILKWPQHAHLRELAASNWQFCPLKEGTYELMFDLLEEAIEATPGSKYIHMGCDEIWAWNRELGVECGCRAKADEIGLYGLSQVYISRVAGHLTKLGRKVLSWGGGYQPNEKIKPPPGLITFGWRSIDRDKASVEAGYPLFLYDPNPGIEHLFLPYFYRIRRGKQVESHLENSYNRLTTGVQAGIYDGMVSTSWNCSGVHNQIWMLRYITGAEYSWSGQGPALEEFKEKYFKNYYGPDCVDLPELFELLNKGSYYYMDCFERKVWHWGEVGKTHLPDLPRDDVEYDPYWNSEYKEMLERSRAMLPNMQRVINICRTNSELGVKHRYDFDLFTRLAEIIAHNCRTYLALSELENAITEAHRRHFSSNQAAYRAFQRAERIIEENLAGREEVFARFKATWEQSQLPRGMSTPEKKYLHGRDQQRNFANRRPDLSFVIYDEQLLDLEGYLEKLREYMEWYKKSYL